MGVRIALDRDKCQGHGMCVMYAPESFVIDAETNVAEVVPAGAARSSRESSIAQTGATSTRPCR